MASFESVETSTASCQQDIMKHPFIYFLPAIPDEYYTHFQQRLILSLYDSFESKSSKYNNASLSKKLRCKKLFSSLSELSPTTSHMYDMRPSPATAHQHHLITEDRLLRLERRVNLLREQLPPMQLAVSNTINNIMMPNVRRQRDVNNISDDSNSAQERPNSPENLPTSSKNSKNNSVMDSDPSKSESNMEASGSKARREDNRSSKVETSKESQAKKFPERKPYIKLTHIDILDIAKSGINNKYLVFITKAGYAGRILIRVINSARGMHNSEQKDVYGEEQFQSDSTGHNLDGLPQEQQANLLGIPESSNSIQGNYSSIMPSNTHPFNYMSGGLSAAQRRSRFARSSRSSSLYPSPVSQHSQNGTLFFQDQSFGSFGNNAGNISKSMTSSFIGMNSLGNNVNNDNTRLTKILDMVNLGDVEWSRSNIYTDFGLFTSDVLLVDKAGQLFVWPIGNNAITPHPQSEMLGLQNEFITHISASRLRASVATASGKVATLYDRSLTRYTDTIIGDNFCNYVVHPLISLDLPVGDAITQLCVSDTISCVATQTGRVFWWGLIPTDLRDRVRDYHNKNDQYREIIPGSYVSLKKRLPSCTGSLVMNLNGDDRKIMIGRLIECSDNNSSNKEIRVKLLSVGGEDCLEEKLLTWRVRDVIFLENRTPVLGRVVAIDRNSAIIECKEDTRLQSSENQNDDMIFQDSSNISTESNLKVFNFSELELASNIVEIPASIDIMETEFNSSAPTSSAIASLKHINTSMSKLTNANSTTSVLANASYLEPVQKTPICIVTPESKNDHNSHSNVIYGHRCISLSCHTNGPLMLLERIEDERLFIVNSSENLLDRQSQSAADSVYAGKVEKDSFNYSNCTCEQESIITKISGLSINETQISPESNQEKNSEKRLNAKFINAYDSSSTILLDAYGYLRPLPSFYRLTPPFYQLSTAFESISLTNINIDGSPYWLLFCIPKEYELYSLIRENKVQETKTFLDNYLSDQFQKVSQPKYKGKRSAKTLPLSKRIKCENKFDKSGENKQITVAESHTFQLTQVPLLFEKGSCNRNIIHTCIKTIPDHVGGSRSKNTKSKQEEDAQSKMKQNNKCEILSYLLSNSHLRLVINYLLMEQDATGATPFLLSLQYEDLEAAQAILNYVEAQCELELQSNLIKQAILVPGLENYTPFKALLFNSTLPFIQLGLYTLLVCEVPQNLPAKKLLEIIQKCYPSAYRCEIYNLNEMTLNPEQIDHILHMPQCRNRDPLMINRVSHIQLLNERERLPSQHAYYGSNYHALIAFSNEYELKAAQIELSNSTFLFSVNDYSSMFGSKQNGCPRVEIYRGQSLRMLKYEFNWKDMALKLNLKAFNELKQNKHAILVKLINFANEHKIELSNTNFQNIIYSLLNDKAVLDFADAQPTRDKHEKSKDETESREIKVSFLVTLVKSWKFVSNAILGTSCSDINNEMTSIDLDLFIIYFLINSTEEIYNAFFQTVFNQYNLLSESDKCLQDSDLLSSDDTRPLLVLRKFLLSLVRLYGMSVAKVKHFSIPNKNNITLNNSNSTIITYLVSLQTKLYITLLSFGPLAIGEMLRAAEGLSWPLQMGNLKQYHLHYDSIAPDTNIQAKNIILKVIYEFFYCAQTKLQKTHQTNKHALPQSGIQLALRRHKKETSVAPISGQFARAERVERMDYWGSMQESISDSSDSGSDSEDERNEQHYNVAYPENFINQGTEIRLDDIEEPVIIRRSSGPDETFLNWITDGSRQRIMHHPMNHFTLMPNAPMQINLLNMKNGAVILARTFSRFVKSAIKLSIDCSKKTDPNNTQMEGNFTPHKLNIPDDVIAKELSCFNKCLEPTFSWAARLLDIAENQVKLGSQFNLDTRYNKTMQSNPLFDLRLHSKLSFPKSSPCEYINYILSLSQKQSLNMLPIIDLSAYEHIVHILDSLAYFTSHWSECSEAVSKYNSCTEIIDSTTLRSSKENTSQVPFNSFFLRQASLIPSKERGDTLQEAYFNIPLHSDIPLAQRPHLLNREISESSIFGKYSSSSSKTFLMVEPTKVEILTYDDVFSNCPTTKPYCEWTHQDIDLRWKNTINTFVKLFLGEGPGSEPDTFLLLRAGFSGRIARFHSLLDSIRSQYQNLNRNPDYLTISRDNLLEDSLTQIFHLTWNYSPHISIQFLNEEAGGPGVNAGFYTALANALKTCSIDRLPGSKSLFGEPGTLPEQATFYAPTPARLAPNSQSKKDRALCFRAIGKFFGMCLWYKQPIPFLMSRHVLKYMLSRQISWHDVGFYNAELYEGLRRMLAHNEEVSMTDEEFKDTYGLTFQITMDNTNIELRANGKNCHVTPKNIHEYVELYSKYLMIECIKDELEEMKKGFQAIIPIEFLVDLTAEDLQLILTGGNTKISFDNLKQQTVIQFQVHCTKHEQNSYLNMLWRIIRKMANTQRQQLLHFATGSALLPSGDAKMFISVSGGRSVDSLPVSSTCSRSMTIPFYKDYNNFKKKLLTAIQCENYGRP